MQKCLAILLVFILHSSVLSHAQVFLNEVQISNASTLANTEGDYTDWAELYNTSTEPVYLGGYHLSDDGTNMAKWTFSPLTIDAGEHLIVFFTGESSIGINHFEAPVEASDVWHYHIPTDEIGNDWKLPGFDDASWPSGPGGIGYDDGDDGTEIAGPVTTIYSRIPFTLTDASAVASMFIKVDYDDAFVAYINGVEVARANIGIVGVLPFFDQLAYDPHDANGTLGIPIDVFEIDMSALAGSLVNGENILTLEVHNQTALSSDMTGNAWLTIGMSTAELQTQLADESDGFLLPEPNASFKLSAGEFLFLSDANNTLVDLVELTSTQADHSIARATDGIGDWCIHPQATPAQTNSSTCFSSYEAAPLFNLQGGVYSGQQTISITSPNANAIIRIAFDGSIPDENDLIYSAPISIDTTTIISACCFSNNALPSVVKKNTYMIDEDAIGLPIVSVSTNPENLWDGETGIYVYGSLYEETEDINDANFYQDWEREAYYEYFDSQHIKTDDGPVGLELHGGASRIHPQKGMRIACKDQYASETMDAPLIAEKPFITQYQGFNLRNGGQAYGGMMFHDAMMQRSMKGTNCDYMGYQPVIVFLNGEYWGYMELREIVDENFVESNHGVNANDASVLNYKYNILGVLSGSSDSYFEMLNVVQNNNVTDADFFETINASLDLYNYADYNIAETFWANTDWSTYAANNVKMWRDDVEEQKWKHALMDMDFGCGIGAGSNPDADIIALAEEGTDNPDILFATLIQNEEFRNYFINRYADLINTKLNYEVLSELVNDMYNEVLPMHERYASVEAFGIDEAGLEYVMNTLRLPWIEAREQGARDAVQSHFNLTDQVEVTLDVTPAGAGRIHISTIEPGEIEYPWQGIYFNGVPVRITAIANPGFTFQHWLPNDVWTENFAEHDFTLNIESDETFTAVFVGTANPDAIEISEVMYNTEPTVNSGDWLELHNKLNVPLNISHWQLKDDNYFNTFQFPLGYTIEANGYVVVVKNIDEFQSIHPDVTNLLGGLSFNISNSSETISALNHAGDTLSSITYEDAQPWPIGADGCGRSIEFITGSIEPNEASNWFAGCISGSPGTAHLPCNDEVVFSEINYHSLSTENAGDWLELLNISNTNIDLSSWTFSADDNSSFAFPASTNLDVSTRMILAEDDILFASQHPGVNYLQSEVSITEEQCLKLHDAESILVFSIAFSNQAPWPAGADGTGVTLEFDNTQGNMCDGNNWFDGCPEGTPLTGYDPLCGGDNVEEQESTVVLYIYPNPTSGTCILRCNLPGQLYLFDSTSRLVYDQHIHHSSTTLSLSDLTSGLYTLMLVNDGNILTQRLEVVNN